MKRKLYLTSVMVLLVASISISTAFALQNSNPVPSSSAPDTEKQIELTDAQKDELKQLSIKMFDIKKQMIQKRLEFGIISKEQANHKLKRLEEIHKKMEQNGYIPGRTRAPGEHGKFRNEGKPETNKKQP